MYRVTLRRALTLAALALFVSLFLSAGALAAPVSLDGSEIFVQLWPEGEPGTNVVIVGTVLPDDTEFPATVRLPVPEGATVFWAGEIMGPDPSTDIQRDFTVVDVEGGKAVEFTVETTVSVQIDATYGTVEVEGNNLISQLEWRQTVDSATTAFAVRTPVGTGDVTIEPEAPAPPQESQLGERLYTLNTAQLEVGDTYLVKVTYRREGVEDAPADSGRTLIWVLGGMLVVAVVALVAAVGSQRRRALPADPAE